MAALFSAPPFTTRRSIQNGQCSHFRSRKVMHASILLFALATQAVAAQDADTVGRAFAENCFSPYLTAQTAHETLAPSGARVDFYDLRPFSNVAPSPVTGRAATPGTDRRCEVAIYGEHSDTASLWLHVGLVREGLAPHTIDIPESFPLIPGKKMMNAVQLNPNRIAVVQAGVRPGPNGVETYIKVERLTPLNEAGS